MDDKTKDVVRKVRNLFKKYGIKSVTMDDVAHELGMSKKTLYEYFSDKSNLVHSVIECETQLREDYFKENQQKSQNAIEEILWIYRFYLENMKGLNLSFEYDLKKYYPDIFSHLRNIKRKKIMEATLANIKKGKAEGFYRRDMNEEVIAKLYVLRIENLPDTDLFSTEERFSVDFRKEMFFYHLYGILSEKGYKYLQKNIDNIEMK